MAACSYITPLHLELVVNGNCHFVDASLLTSHPGLKMNVVAALLVHVLLDMAVTHIVVVDMGRQAVAVAHIVPIVGGIEVDLGLFLFWIVVMQRLDDLVAPLVSVDQVDMGESLPPLSTLRNYSNCWQNTYCPSSSQLYRCSSLEQRV